MAEIIKIQDGSTDVLPVGAESGNGYLKLADGTLFQWGEARPTRNKGQNLTTTTFAIPFISAPLIYCNYPTGYPDIWMASASDSTTTTITCNLYNTGPAASGTGAFYWLAIGRWK